MSGSGPPRLPDDFTDVTTLHEGGRTHVLRARSALHGDVIVKVWNAHDDADRRAFLTEVTLHRALSPDASPHPGIVPFVAASDGGSSPLWLATRAGGMPLPAWLEGRRLTAQDAWRLSSDILDGLAALHERRIVHGDLTPANILVHNGRASLCDLGMARHTGDDDLGEQMGTPEYMAPELVQRMGRHPDVKSDVYAAGAILEDIYSNVECPPTVDHLLTTKAQSQRPADRPTDAADFASRLAQVAQPAGARRQPRRSRGVLAGMAAAAVLVAAVGAWSVMSNAGSSPSGGASGVVTTPLPTPTRVFTIDDPGEGAAVDSPLTVSGRQDLAPNETLWVVTRRGSERYQILLTNTMALVPNSDRWHATFTLGDGKCDEGHSFTILLVALKTNSPLLDRAALEASRGAPTLEYLALPDGLTVKSAIRVNLKQFLDDHDSCGGSGQLIEEPMDEST